MTPPGARTRIAVAMSGGVDSAVAAHLLVEGGYDVFGVTLKLWCYGDKPGGSRSCCSLSAIQDARATCELLGIRHYVLNFEDRFTERVIDRFVDEYVQGRTPNPCVLCNQHVKIGTLLEEVRAIGADALATGHYARLSTDAGGQPVLRRAVDETKDQSYMLWSVPREVLAGTLMPLGAHRKDEVRALARERGIPVAEKRESQDICFVPDGDYAAFVEHRTGGAVPALQPGEIRDLDGASVGAHRGVAHYTIGQRRGLGLSAESALYVVGLDAATNTVTVGPREALLAVGFAADELNWITPAPLDRARRATVKVRYRHAPAAASIAPVVGRGVDVRFDEPQHAVTPGQSAVFYDGDLVLGGAVITRAVGAPVGCT